MHPLIRFVGAFLLAYFVSRITLWVTRAGFGPRQRSLVVPVGHALALLVIAGFLWIIRSPVGAFSPRALFPCVIAQFLWLIIDRTRKIR